MNIFSQIFRKIQLKNSIKIFIILKNVLDDNEVSKIVSQLLILYTLVTDIHLVDYFT